MTKSFSRILSRILLCLMLGFGACTFFTACQTPDKDEIFKQEVKQALEPFYEGEKLLAQKKFDEAKEKYQASIQISPRPKAYYRLAEIAIVQKNLDEAQKNVDEALKLSPDYPQAKKLKNQLDVRQQIVESNPQEKQSTFNVPDQPETAPSMQNTPSESTAAPSTETKPEQPVAQKSIETQPTAAAAQAPLDDQGKAQLEQAKKLGSIKNWTDANDIYEKLIADYKDNPVVFYNYGYALYEQKKFDQAVGMFEKAISIKPDFADAYNDMGVTLENLGKITEAENAYEKAISSGNHGDAYFNLALLKEKQGQYTKAIDNYNAYLKFDPNSTFSAFAKDRIEKLQRKAY